MHGTGPLVKINAFCGTSYSLLLAAALCLLAPIFVVVSQERISIAYTRKEVLSTMLKLMKRIIAIRKNLTARRLQISIQLSQPKTQIQTFFKTKKTSAEYSHLHRTLIYASNKKCLKFKCLLNNNPKCKMRRWWTKWTTWWWPRLWLKQWKILTGNDIFQ